MATQAKQSKKEPVKKKELSFVGWGMILIGVLAGMLLTAGVFFLDNSHLFSLDYQSIDDTGLAAGSGISSTSSPISVTPPKPMLDKEAYAHKLIVLANNDLLKELATTTKIVTVKTGSSTATSSVVVKPSTAQELVLSTKKLWPAKAVYPNPGALLPFNRIVAYYGNFYSTGMGVLGEYPAPEMLQRLHVEVQKWEVADPDTPVIPAIDYIAMTAQGSAGADGMYRFRMPDDQIQHAIDLAAQVHGIVILEVQAGLSNLQTEIESLEPFLILPQVHLAIDPEFNMTTGARPGTVIGSVNASDVNKAAQYLATLVREHNLPPKILIVHRFTYDMVKHADDIVPLPEVQIVMDMDGWGDPAKKFGTYNNVVAPDPVQFTGFKLFYKNDIKPPSTHMLTPQEVLKLSPQPIFIQYQ